MEILETKERKMNKIKREEREDLHTFSDTTGSRPRSINTRVLTNVPPHIITTTNAIMWASNPFDLALLDISLLFIGAKVHRFCL